MSTLFVQFVLAIERWRTPGNGEMAASLYELYATVMIFSWDWVRMRARPKSNVNINLNSVGRYIPYCW